MRALQTLLRGTGIKVAVTGNYLYETSRAVQRFQVAAGLDASGVAGPRRSPRCAGCTWPAGHRVERRRRLRRRDVDTRRLGTRIPLVDGMSGRDVRQLQDYLRRAGVRSAGRPDGEYDAAPSRRASLRVARGSRDRRHVRRRRHLHALQDRRRGRQARRFGRSLAGSAGPAARRRRQGKLGSNGLAIAPEGAPEAVKKIIAAANKIATKPYSYGGGHGRWEDSGYDCSGSVSYALRGAGLLKRPLASYDYFGWGESGKGRWVTIYTNSGHMYIVVAGLRFDTSGRGENGSRWQTATRDPGPFTVRHPAGL